MAQEPNSSQTPISISKKELEEFAMSLEKYKNSLEEFEKIEAEILETVMKHSQETSKEKAREHLRNLLASQ